MKIIRKYILGSFALLVLIVPVSCKREFLEIVPKGQTIAITTADYEKILNANYLVTQFTACVYEGDEMAALQPYFNNMDGSDLLRQQRLFKYEARVYNAADLPSEITGETNYIRKLYLFNKVINEVMDSKGGSEEQKRALLAEARTGRAICNFMFLSDFTKPYNAATADTDLGIPNLTVADVNQKDFKRGTLQAGYDQVISDLTESLPHLGALTHRRKISRLAAEFYLSRVYIAMNNFAAARTHLDAAFLEVQKAQIPMKLYDYTVVLDPENPGAAESWFPEGVLGLNNVPIAANNTEIIYNINAGWFQFQAVNAFVFSPQTAALYAPTDRRLNLYSPFKLFTTTAYPLGMRRRNTDFFNGINVGPSLPDLYLMRAECKARANDLSGAVADLEVLRAKRIAGTAALVPSGIASNQKDLVKFILDERIREFAITGLRWLDMRRLSVDPVYSNHIDFTHMIYGPNGVVTATYQLKPERFALKFGERMLNENKGLEENP
ncbi:RagB/SusD family nutrient uptake outer membrane protein [Chitinophaga sancti]|uniref:RagB/SusD family nutrient uptake outer membrane protein n=1 Tax=Chitinophaga sancti TaxID=1004 RepID=A0A1K1SYP8_9BACT|nr:RagB/SusD family nutrient uptake outer membrane protein [Chitinophaga sancti]WQD62314.1 RagB/SusD family nutrient uptake outer membrane protein [Chitinophaga sancti]WQG92117.1 RagB/SusD family nutrient uptake outer membrane protein [Chitinophaga sancti]SFW89458.1 SusD family protein [Chitinophaga sancti]